MDVPCELLCNPACQFWSDRPDFPRLPDAKPDSPSSLCRCAQKRVEWLSYAYFFIYGWRLDAASRRRLKQDFITCNAWQCIVLNLENVLLLLTWIISDPSGRLRRLVPVALQALGEQANEHYFLPARSMRSDRNF